MSVSKYVYKATGLVHGSSKDIFFQCMMAPLIFPFNVPPNGNRTLTHSYFLLIPLLSL